LKILLLTGRLAEPTVREAALKCPPSYDLEVLVMPVDVAALASPKSVASYLKGRVRLGDYDLIMVSGAIQGSVKAVEDVVGVKVVKGPKHAVDIPMLLNLCDPRKLSPEVPADLLFKREMRKFAKRILVETEVSVQSRPHIAVGKRLVPVEPPPVRVVSEVSGVHLLTEERLLEAVRRRIDEGADMISLGFEAGVANPERVKDAVRLVKREYDFPLILDSMIPSEIVAGVDAGVDMIMSLEAGNMGKVADKVRQLPVVIIPYDSEKGLFARTVEDKLRLLEVNIKKAYKMKVKNIVADPILDPITLDGIGGTSQSLIAYHLFKQRRPDIPLLMGLCNVAELMDVDSVGVNALLTMLAAELGASMVLVAEKSVKAAGSTTEAAIASQMATIAWKKKTPPKDLGLNLLIFKDKRKVDIPLDVEGAEVVEVHDKPTKYPLDPLGIFTIRVNHEEGLIEVLYKGAKGKTLMKGKSAASICNEILRRGMLSMLSHALYLGAELSKAEEALRTGKSYVQEENLFERAKPIDLSN